MNTYEQLEAAVLPIITHYHDDLIKHDRKAITDNPGVPFLHWGRDYGTHIQMHHPADSAYWPAPGSEVPYLFSTTTRERIAGQFPEMARYFLRDRSQAKLIHHFDGRELHKITIERAVVIAEDFLRSLHAAWSRKQTPTPA
jgi:hypothetical protein